MPASLRVLRYQHGHFYDPFTGERLSLAEHTVYTLLTDNAAGFVVAPPVGKPFDPSRDPLPTAAQQLELAGKAHWLLLPRGTKLYFEVHAPGSPDERFEVELYEDLFLVAPNLNDSPLNASLHDCRCIAQPLRRELPDLVYGSSLNDVLKSTYVHYFHNLGNPAANVFKRMKLPGGTTLDKLRQQLASNQPDLFGS
ncbi:hypothetical protein [Hymenobacter chitinivorans]|uniref:Uncharacterized protein n=1 Tax=Hymenobacter chitinivorans DSM 11115 TaxID=1121954 RepID=A0A2M9B9I5_9BACT|nr:hypothetical protein [Hymenobacter chitinivorans]PJJ54611.1 hypothetical protein CLV45_2952 [Hymenobacter chitinivorans DSM 11115]